MFENNNIRLSLVVVTFLIAMIWMMPNFYRFQKDEWWFSKNRLIYGLDIQGGLHLVMGVKVNEAIYDKLSSFTTDLKKVLKKHQIEVESLTISKKAQGQMILNLKQSDTLKAQKVLQKQYTGTLLGGVPLRVLSSSDHKIVLGYNELELIRLRKSIIAQVVEVIRRRIDEFGVSEPIITAQGEDRVLVQLPGVKDATSARDIIQRTAQLEFRLVNTEVKTPDLIKWVSDAEKKGQYLLNDQLSYLSYVKKINADLKDKIPAGHTLVFQKAGGSNSLRAGKVPVLVRTDSGTTGDILQTAFVGVNDFGNPEVLFHIDVAGRKVFSELTGSNIGKPLAIILDKELKSMPVIKSRISDRGSIDLGRSPDIRQEAETIATILRAGALPAQLFKMEERTVGPTLGRDSIQKGKMAGWIAGLVVVIFMFFYYRLLGLVANLALGLNILFLLAILTSLGAVLTLPGVAGIILTIGMAVDANVIIYERLKEELKKGSSLLLAVKDGYRYALSAILDANITTAIVCVILMSFGTGPIRGFAVTLFCGIVTSLFTAVFVSRTFLTSLINRFSIKSL